MAGAPVGWSFASWAKWNQKSPLVSGLYGAADCRCGKCARALISPLPKPYTLEYLGLYRILEAKPCAFT